VILPSHSFSTMFVYISGCHFLQKYSQISDGVARISLVCLLHMVGVYRSWRICLGVASVFAAMLRHDFEFFCTLYDHDRSDAGRPQRCGSPSVMFKLERYRSMRNQHDEGVLIKAT
jgi:hypothetical protein